MKNIQIPVRFYFLKKVFKKKFFKVFSYISVEQENADTVRNTCI